MATKHWLTGCGIGCLLTVMIGVIAGFVLFRAVKDTVGEFDQVSEMQAQLRRDYGGMEDYVPPADGRIPATRIEAFLRIQEAIQPTADELAATVEHMRELEDGDGFSLGKVVSAVKGVRTLGTSLGQLLRDRNQALLDQGMGLGEHTYLTALIYHGWLGQPLRLSLDGDDSTDRRGEVRDVLRGFLERQRDAAQAAGDPSGLLPALDHELTTLVADPDHVPWRDGLPPAIEESLTPYRDRLATLSTDLGIIIGVGTQNDGGGFSFNIE